VRAALLVAALACGCAELGVVTDGTTISYGQPNRGRLIDGVRMPDHGEGFTSRATWVQRGSRFGTDELVDLLTGVARRMRPHARDTRLVIADLSRPGGGEARPFHRSHQTGRDVDLLFYMRDARGKPVEATAMIPLDARGVAKDGSGLRLDVPRMWRLVRELIDAPEAVVQFIFIYGPHAQLLLGHAQQIGEPELLVERARKALKQPGPRAPHDDHIHVRIYCAPSDRAFGCIDIGPMELLAEREAEQQQRRLATLADEPLPPGAPSSPADVVPLASAEPTFTSSFYSMLRTRADRIDLRGWR
jgi:penicillin-insensitive murein DD-endopeptidase